MGFFTECINKGVKVYFTKTDIKIDETIESQILIFAFAMASQIERDLISARTKSALQTARRNGKKLGRPIGSKSNSKLLIHQNEIKNLLELNVPKKHIAKKYNCSYNTLQKFIIFSNFI